MLCGRSVRVCPLSVSALWVCRCLSVGCAVLREAKILKRIEHENVIKLHDVIEVNARAGWMLNCDRCQTPVCQSLPECPCLCVSGSVWSTG